MHHHCSRTVLKKRRKLHIGIMKLVRRAMDKYKSKPICVYQNRRYLTRKDFKYLCFYGVFEYEKLPIGRYYILLEHTEEAIKDHVKIKFKNGLSLLQSYTTANWKSGTRQ